MYTPRFFFAVLYFGSFPQLAKGFLPLLVRTKTAFDRLFGSIENRDTDDDEELSDCLMKGKSDLLIVLSNCSYSFFELLECTDERAVISPSDGLLAGKGRKCSKTGGVDVGLQTIASSSEDVTDMAIDDVGLRSTVVTLEQFFFDVQQVDAAIGGVGLSARSEHIVHGVVVVSTVPFYLLASLLAGFLPLQSLYFLT